MSKTPQQISQDFIPSENFPNWKKRLIKESNRNYPVVNAENIIKMHLIIWLLIDFSQKMACFIE